MDGNNRPAADSPLADPESVRLQANGLTLHCKTAGPPDGPLLVLLHGFPEGWYGWRHQIAPLATAGFRVLVPDQRGYGESDKPVGVASYRLDTLAADVAALIAATGKNQAFLVGHDWGGVVAWRAAARYPELVAGLAVLNAPHPGAIGALIRRRPGQFLRSWYVGFFQFPLLPEWLARRRRFAFLRSAMAGSALPGTFSPADFRRYREAWSQPGALTAMVNWYRAGRMPRGSSGDRIRQPVLILWGERDRFLDKEFAAASARLCDRADVRFFPRATHWLQHEAPEAVSEALARFFRSPG